MKLRVIGLLLLSVIALGHSQDSECIQNEAAQNALEIANACGGVDDDLVNRLTDVSHLECDLITLAS